MLNVRKPVIGLEIHIELKTKTKMFCDSLNDPDEKRPNFNVCPICMGHPGTLPVANKDAIYDVIKAGLALNCHINSDTFFERKNYFYPDLPKGYQITQYQKPFCYEGYLEISLLRQGFGGQANLKSQISKQIRVTRIHLEEDAGRLYHPEGTNYSLVDYNRAGVPLMELVTEPDFENGQEVKKFAEELQLIMRYLHISDADMEKGQLRVEVNISLTGDGPDAKSIEDPRFDFRAWLESNRDKWGTKAEIKNLNSIRAAANAVDYEIKRQNEILDDGGKIIQETRGWDETKGITFSQRSKEEAHDYRYFPEPDLPPIHFKESELEVIKKSLPELPEQRRARFKKLYILPESDIEIFTVNKSLGDYFEEVASELLSFDNLEHLKRPDAEHQEKLYKIASNYLITELNRMAGEVMKSPGETKISAGDFADLIVRIFHKEISSSAAQTVLREMFETGNDPGEIIKIKDLAQVSDTGELEMIIDKIIDANAGAVQDYKKGKEASLKFLIGMVMRESRGKANPQLVEEILLKRLTK